MTDGMEEGPKPPRLVHAGTPMYEGRPEGRRPEGGRPEEGRPEGGRPEGL